MANLDWIVSVLKTTPGRWLGLAEMLPQELMRLRPAEGEWSALECLGHIAGLEETVFQSRLKAIRAGRDFPAFDPDAAGNAPEPGYPAVELALEFQRSRLKGITLVEQLLDEDFSRTALHAELGRVSMTELLHEWAAHDLMHTMQAERALMQPFIQGCGPWQTYFSAHIIL